MTAAWSDFRLTLEEGRRQEAVGPLYFAEQIDAERGWGIAPLITYAHAAMWTGRKRMFCIRSSRGGVLVRSTGRNSSSSSVSPAAKRKRSRKPGDLFTIFPLYFQKRAPDERTLNYTAVVPIYGHLENRLFHDDIKFALFPALCRDAQKGCGDGQLSLSDFPYAPRWRCDRMAGLAGAWDRAEGADHGDEHPGRTGNLGWLRPPFCGLAVLFQGLVRPRHHQRAGPFLLDPLLRPAALAAARRNVLRLALRLLAHRRPGTKNIRNAISSGRWSCWRAGAKTRRAFFRFTAGPPCEGLESDFYLWPLYKYNKLHHARFGAATDTHSVFPLFRFAGKVRPKRRDDASRGFLAVLHLETRPGPKGTPSSPGVARAVFTGQPQHCARLFAPLVFLARGKNPQTGRGEPVASMEPLPA